MYFCHKIVIFKFIDGFLLVCLTKTWACLTQYTKYYLSGQRTVK